MFVCTLEDLTFVVTREHDSTTHDVPFKAAWAERISNPAAVEDLPVICTKKKKPEKLF